MSLQSMSSTYDSPFRRRPMRLALVLLLLVLTAGAMVGGLSAAEAFRVHNFNPWRECTLPNRLVSASHLKSIGQACLLYSNDFRYQMPPDQATMVRTEDIGPEVFVDPHSNTLLPDSVRKDPTAGPAWVQAYSDYEYLGGGLDIRAIPADVIVAYERHLPPENAAYGRNALFGDGHVDWLTKREFDGQIAKSQACLEALRSAALTLRLFRL